jgi:quinol-cytochrome oxidoreductase complex cytochrome b subunit
MALNAPEQYEPYISHEEVQAWLNETIKRERQRKYRTDDKLFYIVWYLFGLVLFCYIILQLFGII